MSKYIHEVKLQYKRPKISEMHQIAGSSDAVKVMRNFLTTEQIDLKEYFWVMVLNRSNHVLGISQVSEGSTVATVVNVKEIFQIALKTNAVAVILFHNHPSGNLNPSEADKRLTNRVKSFSEMIDVAVLDHIIITSEGYHSFADELEL